MLNSGNSRRAINLRLNSREMLFCLAYLASGMNKTEAVATAFPKVKKHRRLDVANRMLKRTRVQNYLRETLRRKLLEGHLTIDKVLALLQKILLFDPAEAFKRDPTTGALSLKDLSEMPFETRLCISEARIVTEEVDGEPKTMVELKFFGREKALELAMKYLGIANDPASGELIGRRIDFDALCSDDTAIKKLPNNVLDDDIIDVKLKEHGKNGNRPRLN
ncbi:MAG: hypothetical protein KatS3mg087_1210 [Patescibacteria group bacterium]|nr:MAG: hypothetical protein KatS3mg087_1210 [Patescibacteria group bacterium]